ncbi:MAG: radical SAM protein [Spirochaetales bacterium]|nr:radical SAM protein [Spirochaetales bacterium]
MSGYYLERTNQEFKIVANQLGQIAKNCELCGNRCRIDRLNGEVGRCGSSQIEVSKVQLHFFEEPCISGEKGSGTIFFTNCPMQCCFCQNYKISQNSRGKVCRPVDLAQIMIQLQQQGAHNINLVNPTHFLHEIVQALSIAKNLGLNIPIVYNSGGFESLEAIKLLDGFINVYLPDAKYADNSLALKYSKINNYVQTNRDVIKEMKRQVGNPIIENGIIEKGLIIRHLILPNYVENSKDVLEWIADELGMTTWVSLMSQYFPTYKATSIPELNSKISEDQYNEVYDFFQELALFNGYVQDLSSASDKYVPDF